MNKTIIDKEENMFGGLGDPLECDHDWDSDEYGNSTCKMCNATPFELRKLERKRTKEL
jgi:hypothetical protein